MELNKTILSLNTIDAKKEIFKSVLQLCQDLTVIIEKKELDYITDRLYYVIQTRHKGLTFKYFEKALIEVQTNCILYRTVNVGTILTALNKVLQ